jgi:outer membrane protein assembly factor BamD (BamD/ComL family)
MKYFNFKIVGVGFLLLFAIACTSKKDKLIATINSNEKILFADEMITPKEDSIAKILVADYQQFAKENETDSLAPVYLFKGADVAKNIGQYKLAIDMWGKICAKYPTSKQAANSMFFQAFTYQTAINDTAKAKLIFQDFISKYPTNTFVKDAKFSIEQMESKLSDDEIVAKFMRNLEVKK